MTGDLDDIGIGLGHTGRNGADADFGNQLDADRSSGMHLVKVMDQLGQVLNRIDVVMRRWRDQGHTRFAVAQPGDVLVDLRTGKLTSFAGLGSLSHLDLQLFSAPQVFRCDAEAPRGDLFDR